MSLFGSSPEATVFSTPNTSNKRSSLFEDDPPAKGNTSKSLFAEENIEGADEEESDSLFPSARQPRTTKAAASHSSPPRSQSQAQPETPTPPQKQRNMATSGSEPSGSAAFDDADPWASPAMHRGHEHAGPDSSQTSGLDSSAGTIPQRTIATRTTSQITTDEIGQFSSEDTVGDNTWQGHQSFSGDYGNDYAPPPASAAPAREPRSRTSASKGAIHRGVAPEVVVNAMPNKEGMFMFQHRNYEVVNARGSSTVIRRYSDFAWLLDCLYKRYPFRLLPLLPPKRVAVNGNHLATNATFLEKRRRGLVRFLSALVKHPVLKQDQLVVMFLSVPTELSVWRKQAAVTVEEEFLPRLDSLQPGLEASLPRNLTEIFETARIGIKRSADVYINLCNLVERLVKRNEGMASDSASLSLALEALTETSESTYTVDQNDVPMLNEGLKSTAKHLQTGQTLMNDEARGWDEGVLEDFKTQRDALVSARDMFERKDRYDRDNIPTLEQRIARNDQKLANLRSNPNHKLGEPERIQDLINKDIKSIREQKNRSVLVKECIRDELKYFQSTLYHISKMHQDWSLERVKYAELMADNWRALSEELESMPVGETQ